MARQKRYNVAVNNMADDLFPGMKVGSWHEGVVGISPGLMASRMMEAFSQVELGNRLWRTGMMSEAWRAMRAGRVLARPSVAPGVFQKAEPRRSMRPGEMPMTFQKSLQ
jgi:hypothetical protein